MLISYLTWIMAFTNLTAISVGCKSIATCFIHCTLKHWTFNCVTDTGIYMYKRINQEASTDRQTDKRGSNN